MIVFGEAFLVVLEFVVLEHAGAGEPGPHAAFLGLENLLKLVLRHALGPDEIHGSDLYLGGFLDLEDHRAAAGVLVDLHAVLHLALLVARLLVHAGEFLGVREELPFVEGFADFGGELLLKLGGGEVLVALELDVGEYGLALDDVGEADGFVGEFLDDADVVEVAGAVQRTHILIDGGARVVVADTDADV